MQLSWQSATWQPGVLARARGLSQSQHGGEASGFGLSDIVANCFDVIRTVTPMIENHVAGLAHELDAIAPDTSSQRLDAPSISCRAGPSFDVIPTSLASSATSKRCCADICRLRHDAGPAHNQSSG